MKEQENVDFHVVTPERLKAMILLSKDLLPGYIEYLVEIKYLRVKEI